MAWKAPSGTLRWTADIGDASVTVHPSGKITWEVLDTNRFASGGLGAVQTFEEFLHNGHNFADCPPPPSVEATVRKLLHDAGIT